MFRFGGSLKKEMPSMFADPQSVTINAVANSLPRVASGTNSGSFSKDDQTVQLAASHTIGKSRTRHLIRLDHNQIAADPLAAGINVKATMAAYLVIDVPATGYSLATQKQVVDGLTLFLTTSSGANVTKLLGGES